MQIDFADLFFLADVKTCGLDGVPGEQLSSHESQMVPAEATVEGLEGCDGLGFLWCGGNKQEVSVFADHQQDAIDQ